MPTETEQKEYNNQVSNAKRLSAFVFFFNIQRVTLTILELVACHTTFILKNMEWSHSWTSSSLASYVRKDFQVESFQIAHNLLCSGDLQNSQRKLWRRKDENELKR